MSVFDDNLIPQYVGKITCAKVVWPLLFTLTDDGIVCIFVLNNDIIIVCTESLSLQCSLDSTVFYMYACILSFFNCTIFLNSLVSTVVYNLTSTKCICAINPIEYCRLCYPQQQGIINYDKCMYYSLYM